MSAHDAMDLAHKLRPRFFYFRQDTYIFSLIDKMVNRMKNWNLYQFSQHSHLQ